METITNVEVSKVYPGPKGEGEYGPWQIWNFYLKDDKRKFSFFEKDGLIPQEGMQIQVLKFEVKQKGEYTNHDVKELTLQADWYDGKEPESSEAVQSTISTKRDSSVTMYISYAKDLMVALLASGAYPGLTLEQAADLVTQVGMMMQDEADDDGSAQPNTDPIEIPEPGTTDDVPLPDEPPPY